MDSFGTIKLDESALEEAKWAACNTQWDEDAVPSMEKASEMTEVVVKTYLESLFLEIE